MKNFSFTFFSIIAAISICVTSCKKEQSSLHNTTLILYNKSLSTIQLNIQGSWKLQYEKGGVCSTCKTNFSNSEYLWEFNSGTKIKQTYNNLVLTDAPIKWIKDLGSYTNGDSTYVLGFDQSPGYIVDDIFNDTLKLHDAYVVDAVFYYLTKRK